MPAGLWPCAYEKPRSTFIESGRFVISAQMANVTHVAPLARSEQRLTRIAPEQLSGRLEKQPRIRNQTRHGNARIGDTIFSADAGSR